MENDFWAYGGYIRKTDLTTGMVCGTIHTMGRDYASVKRWRHANPEKWAEQRKRYRAKHPEVDARNRVRYRVERKEYEVARRKRLSRWIDEYKVECGCSFCGLDIPWCLDFHHLEPGEKEYNMSQIVRVGWKRTLVELEKCVVVCANCHRKIIH